MRTMEVRICFCLIALAALFASGASWCQVYPSKPVRLVVSTAPGSASDTVARMLSQPWASASGSRLWWTTVPAERIRTKAVAVLDDHCRAFIAKCPFVLIGSCDADGNMDVSPKGDPAGFVRVLDDSTLAIPDRPGNRRADTSTNVLQRPQVGLLFLIPGRSDTLRINGGAMIVKDRWLCNQMAVSGNAPDLAMVVRVKELFFHCPKCMARSRLWDPGQWPDLGRLASHARIKVERGKLDVSVEEMEALVGKNTREKLY